MTTETTGLFWKGRRRRITALVAILAMLAGFAAVQLTSLPAGAQDIDESFELDGNPQDTPSGVPDDWGGIETTVADNTTTVLSSTVRRVARTQIPIPDLEATDVSYFKGGGSKDERDISGAGQHWLHSSNDVAPDKNSILNAAAVAYKVPDGPDSNTADDLLIDFTLDRLANDGDAVVGFWFFKNRVSALPSPSQDFSGAHAVGDILVVSDFSGGGDVSKIRVYRWTGTKGAPIQLLAGNETGDPDLPGSGANVGVDCVPAAGKTVNPYICGTANKVPVAAEWPYTPKSGASGTYPVASFYEGGININAIVPASDGCFASFLAMTRSSTSTTAQLKDFVLGDFPICAPSTTMSALPTTILPEITVVGDSVTYSFTETNNGNVPLTNVYLTDDHASCTLSPTNVATLAVGASQIFTCSFASTAEGITTVTATGHGTSELGDVTYCGSDTTTPPNICATGQIHDADERATAKSVAITPGTELSISRTPTGDVKTSEDVQFTIKEKNDGTAPTDFTAWLNLTSVAISTNISQCNNTLARTVPSGAADVTLSQGEEWTYTCTVTSPDDDFTLEVTGVGTVLAGSPHARVVTYSPPAGTPPVATCANAVGTSTTVGRYCDTEEYITMTVVVISPSTILEVTASALITFTFKESNDSEDAPLVPPAPTSRESVISIEESSVCNDTALAYVGSGDADNDKILDPGETWEFTCKGTLAGPGGTNTSASSSKSASARGRGTESSVEVDDVTYCGTASAATTSEADKVCDPNERDKVTVTITNQPRGANPPVI
jgi:hypothetical protein